MGHQHTMLRVVRSENAHEWLGGPSLTDRNRVDPDQRFSGLAGAVVAETLRNMLTIARLMPRTPCEARERIGQHRIHEAAVYRASCAHRSIESSARSTSPALGVFPARPILVARAHP